MSSKTFTAEEVAKHSKDSDLWLIIQGKVYDATKFVDEHPGGVDVLLEHAGKDATSAFEDVGHSTEARKQLASLQIGVVEGGGAKVPEKKVEVKKVEDAAPASQAGARPADYKYVPGQAPPAGSAGLGRFAVPLLIASVAVAVAVKFFVLK